VLKFLVPGCYEIRNATDEREQTGELTRARLTRSVEFRAQPPLEAWGLLVGDTLMNLRATLDYLVYAISYSRNPGEFEDDRSTEFTIADSGQSFARRAPRELRGLPTDASALIEGLQPYHRSSVEEDPLWLLREMSNIDKHRSLHLCTWVAHEVRQDITALAPGVRLHSHTLRKSGPIQSGDTLVELEVSYPKGLKAVMSLDKTFNFTIALDESLGRGTEPLPDVLRSLGAHVSGIVASLDPFVLRPTSAA
jgi:hypothetical protein